MLPPHLFVEIVDYSTKNYNVIGRELNNQITNVENSVYWRQQYQQSFNTVIPANAVPDALTWKEEYCRVLKYKHVLHKITKSTEVNISDEGLIILPLELKNMSKLTKLYCHRNSLTEIPNTFTQLTELICSNNQITEIPNTFTQLTWLNCFNNQITEIPNTFTQLTWLKCSDNQLIKIPNTLTQLTWLNCFNNQITEISNTMTQLFWLDCSNNQITEISNTFTQLIKLICDKNVIVLKNIRKQLQ